MKKLFLLVVLLALASFSVSATVYWNSSDHWTADNTTVPGFQELSSTSFQIANTQATQDIGSTRTFIKRVETVEWIHFQLPKAITSDDIGFFKYYATSGASRILGYFGTDNTIKFVTGAGNFDVEYNYSQPVKIQVNNGSSNYVVFVNGTEMGTFSWNSDTDVIGAMYFDPGNTQQYNVSWFCSDNDGKTCNNQPAPPPPPSGIGVNITGVQPGNNTQWSTASLPLTVNFTTENWTDQTANITLYIDGVKDQSQSGITTNVTSSWTMYKAYGSVEETHSYYFYVESNGSTVSDTSTTNTYFIDNVDPSMTWTTPNDFIIAGGDSYWPNTYSNDHNFTAFVTLTDNNLYSYYMNLSYANGTIIQTWNNTSLLGLTEFNISQVIDTSPYADEVLNLTVQAFDGHTKQAIRDFNTRKNGVELQFDDVRVYPENSQSVKNAGWTRKVDRYEFDYEYHNPARVRHYYVESEEEIVIAHGLTEYEGHLITGNKWIDFESDDIERVDVTRITTKKVKITVTLNNPRATIKYRSIGELNSNTESRPFYVASDTEQATDPLLTGSSQTFYLNITANTFYNLGGVNATLYYNGTSYTAGVTNTSTLYELHANITIPTLTTNTNLTYYWIWEVNGVDYNTTQKTSQVQIPGIDDCSSYTTSFTNYTLRDELNDTLITGNIEFIFDYNYTTFSGIYNGTRGPSTSFDFCLYPSDATFNSDVRVQYSATGYATRDYVQQQWVVNNNTQQITLYLLETGVGTDITFHVKNRADDDLPGVQVEAYRWDLSTNTDKLVQSEETDIDGNLKFTLKTGTEYYRFVFYQKGAVVLNTTRFKLFATDYEYIIDTKTVSPLGEWLQINNEANTTLKYTNTSQLVQFTWAYSGSLIDNFCLRLEGNGTIYTDSCSTTVSSGQLNYTITELNITYTAIGYAKTTTGNEYNLQVLGIDTRITIKDLLGAGLSLFIVLIVFLTISLIALVEKTIAVGTSMVALIVLWWFALLPVSLPALMGLLAVGTIVIVVINKT